MGEQSKKLDSFNEELENIKKSQTEMKNTITEMKNTLERINSRLDGTKEWIHKLEDRVVGITGAEQKKQTNKQTYKKKLGQSQCS